MRATTIDTGEVRFGEHLKTLLGLLPFLWPKGRRDLKSRVLLAAVFLIAAKVATVYVPLLLGRAVDALNPEPGALLAAVPVPDPDVEAQREHTIVKGEVPSPMDPPSGCVFHPRCSLEAPGCRKAVPPLREVRPEHWAACTEV